jgi:uncharacterized protein YndB with AHSA1/START domain
MVGDSPAGANPFVKTNNLTHMTSPKQPADGSPKGEIVNTRIFAASPSDVFRAFSDPARLAQWWGPEGFTNTFHEFDFRTGGAWRFTMHAPDGKSYAMDKQFLEVVAPQRVVLRHFQSGHDFTLTMTFTTKGPGTELSWRMRFDDPEEGERLRSFLGPANEQNLERLATHLMKSTPLT